MPKVSVILPLYNAERYIKATLNSILSQTYQDFEIIIVNDKGSDNSINIVREFEDKKIKIYENSANYGIAYTRNKAIELSTGEYIALMDHDDIAPNTRLEKQVTFLNDNSDIDVVGGHCRHIDHEGNIVPYKTWNAYLDPAYIKAFLMLGNTIYNSSVMFRRSFVQQNNITYKDDMYGTEDYMFWVECSLYGKISNIDEVLAYWRTGDNNETSRVMKNFMNERKKRLDYVHTYALEKNGFILDKEELAFLNKVFMEEGTLDSKEEIMELYYVLRKIAKQSIEKGMENSKAVVTMCRKRFGEKIGKAFYLWDI